MESSKKSSDITDKECKPAPSEDKLKDDAKIKLDSGVQDVIIDSKITLTPTTNECGESTTLKGNKIKPSKEDIPNMEIDSDSDFPDDFFDDFGKDEFMSALDPFDSFDEVEGEDKAETNTKQTNVLPPDKKTTFVKSDKVITLKSDNAIMPKSDNVIMPKSDKVIIPKADKVVMPKSDVIVLKPDAVIMPTDVKNIKVKRPRMRNTIFNKIFNNSHGNSNLIDQRPIPNEFNPYSERFENRPEYEGFPSVEGDLHLRSGRYNLGPDWQEEEMLNRPLSLSPPRFQQGGIRDQRRSRSPRDFRRNRDHVPRKSFEEDRRRDHSHRRSYDDNSRHDHPHVRSHDDSNRRDREHRRSHDDDHRRGDYRRRKNHDNHKRSHDDNDRRKRDDRPRDFIPRVPRRSLERNVSLEHLGASIADIRRDISKTRRAIQIDKDMKAKELFEKRIRIVETGLVPPGMEADVVINRKTSQRVDFPPDKIRLSQGLEVKNQDPMRERQFGSKRPEQIKVSSPPFLRRSPLPPMREPRRRSRENYRPLPRPSKPRSPFLTEIARKLKERSEERHIMQVLNPPDLVPQVPQNYFPGGGMPYNYNAQQYFQTPYVPPAYPIPQPVYPNPVVLPPQPNFFSGPPPSFSTNVYQANNLMSMPSSYANEPVPAPVPPPSAPGPEMPMTMIKSEPTLDDLLEQKKISVADYMKLTLKPKGASMKEMSALNNRVELLSRCQNAVKKLNQFHKPNNLVYNPEIDVNYEINAPSAGFRSPLKRKQFVKYGFTTPLKLNKDENDQILSNIVAMIGLKNIMQDDLEQKHIETIKDASVQTTSSACDFCQIRENTKFISCGTDTNDLYTMNSVQSQVTETDLQISKSMFVGVQATTQNPVSLTHLTPSQILASELAAKARSYQGNDGQSNQLPRNTQNSYQNAQSYQNNPQGYQKNPQGYQQNAHDYVQNSQDYQQKPQGYQQKSQNYQHNAQDYQQKSQDYQQNAQGSQNNFQGYQQNAQGYHKNPQGFQKSVKGFPQKGVQDQSNFGKNTYNNSNYNTYAWQ